MTQPGAIDTSIRTLGTPKLTSRLPYRTWVDDVRLPIQVDRELCDEFTEPVRLDFEAAGPRKKLYFDPSRAKCAIVTCGGLCPGLNDVIRAIVMEAHHAYHVPSIMGIRYGLEGFIPACGHQPMELTPERVADIHRFGGTILGSSRGPQSAEEIVDSLERSNVSILFVIGGDGSMKAALSISREVQARNLKIAVIGIPKTIDNDINFIPQSFGFETAVAAAFAAAICDGGAQCAVLAPTTPGAFGNAANVLTHVVVPVCAIADLFVAKHDAPDFGIAVWALVPLIYYLAFATIGFVLNWDFGNGRNYPYFFLNWTSPAGVFGFGGGGEYFMGTFWWILVMIALVLGIALAYAAILKRVRGGAAGKAATETEVVVGDAANDAETQEENASEDGSNADKDRQ